ncbi:MAG TPA: prepilin peptidase [Solirubrobacteraceae bacterium]|jgi:leader peptidase (prepilin peptidase)/N-methyltransferase
MTDGVLVMTVAMAAAFAGVAGAILGSFLNVVIARLPVHESLVTPRSRCPRCETPVRPYDNVPVLSWLLLRGRCRDCAEPISRRYPLVELLTAVLLAAVVLAEGADRDVWLGLAFVLVLVPVTFIDLDHRIIPNRITGPAAVVAIALLLLTRPDDLTGHLIAAAAAGGFLLIAALAYPAGMGMGDVKLAAVMGLYLGRAVGPAMLVALVAGSVVGALIIARKGVQAGRKTGVPFGPFLAFGGLVALFVGDAMVDWYLDTFV